MTTPGSIARTNGLILDSASRPSGIVLPCARCQGALQARAGIGKHFSLGPAIILLLLPKCPLCLAAWLGILGSVGASSWLSHVWGTPLAALCLSFAVATLARRAVRHRDSRPFWLGLVGALALFYGKNVATMPVILYSGLALLTVAVFWSGYETAAATQLSE